MMTRCKLQGGDGEVEKARWEWQGGDWRAGRGCQVGRCWGQERMLGWRRLVQGEAVRLEEAVDGEVKMVGWR